MADADIIARFQLKTNEFSGPLKSTLDDLNTRTRASGAQIKASIGGALGDVTRDFSAQIPVIGNSLSGLSGGLSVAAAGVGGLAVAYGLALKEAEEYAKATRALDATLTATGNKTGFLREQLVAFAEEAEGRLAIPAEDILKTQAALATFDGVSGPIFQRTIEAAADLAASFGGDLQGNAEKLGTVIQNLADGNVEGLRKGFKFLGTENLDLIESLAETGKTSEAVETALSLLEGRLGGAAEANAAALTGATFRFKDAWADLLRTLGDGETGAAAASFIDALALRVGSVGTLVEDLIRGFQTLGSGGGKALADIASGRRGQDLLNEATLARSGSLNAFGFSLGKNVPAPPRAANDDPVARTKALKSAEKERNDALRSAEKARESALDKELDLLQKQADKLREIEGVVKRLDAEGGSLVKFPEAIGPKPGDNFAAPDFDELQRSANRSAEAAGLVAKKFEDDGIQAAQAIAQAFGGKVGGEISKVAGVIRGLGTGDFNSVGGQAGGVLSLVFGKNSESGKALKKAFEPILGGLEKTFDGLATSLGLGGASGLLGSAAAGAGLGSLVGGGTSGAAIGGAIGGVAGQALGNAILPGIGGAIGQVLGSAIGGSLADGPVREALSKGLGGILGAILFKTRKGSVSLSGADGDVSIGGATGNGGGQRKAATSLGGAVADSLRSIADQLGGTIGAFSVSVGQRNTKFAVDPTGRGNVSTKYGAKNFDTAEEAARFAVQDALADGALAGVSQTIQNAVRNASSIEKGLQDALTLQSITTRLRQFESPVTAAIAAVDKEFRGLEKALRAAGGTAAELADLQKLYDRERDSALERGLATLKDFSDSLKVGSGSPLGLGQQRSTAEAAFAALEAEIRAGKEVDQGKFVAAGQTLLDVERQISGGTQDFFATFDRVQSATQAAIDKISNAVPIRDSFAERTAAAAQSTAETNGEILNAMNVNNSLLERIAAQMALSGAGGFVGADALARGFSR